ncbi:DsbA family oxidoreductase [Streptomyces lancefieldiae]|uniref:DsbA family oxidoreductase n=1 Tax=Streptomyces lancefieldiae TaxID=3075520 RepID=A0ABU3ARF0_9ACTN|nr:DsbA family oxidoreductase [Streptomyces sp. DSM 40712]MDT0612756.1 DsbA family oxidoreductase [Streptomyces sp. DSM 40712]
MRVDIWSDITCPWCYLGRARFKKAQAAFAHGDRLEVVHRSFELDPHRAKSDVQLVIPMLMSSHHWSEEQAKDNERRLTRLTAADGLGYIQNRDHGNTHDMHRLLQFARERGRDHELLDLLFLANYADERSLFNDDERLVALAEEAGLAPEDARAVLADPAAFADAVRADSRKLTRLGGMGVPFMLVSGSVPVSGVRTVTALTGILEEAWSATTRAGADAGAPAVTAQQ